MGINKTIDFLKTVKTDCFSIILTIVGIIISINSVNNTESVSTSIVCAIAAQLLVIIAWCYVLYIKYKVYKGLGDKNYKIKLLQNEIRTYKKKINDKDVCLANERANIIRQHKVIASAIKNNSIHSNTMLKRIPAEAEKQYRLIEILSNSNTEGVEDTVDEAAQNSIDSAKFLTESLKQFRDSLYNLFKQHCREVTDEAKKLQTALLALKGHSRAVSITIKLLVNPYNSDEGKMQEMRVYTAFRDNDSYEEKQREIGIELYTIAGNTDFLQCLSEENFIINNATGDDRSYRNENRGFPSHYNCAVVVPIRIKRASGDFKLFGFLCCDCLNEQKVEVFDEINAEYLFALGQNLASFLETLDSNWVDRTQDIDVDDHSILEVLYNKIYRGKGQVH